MGGLCGRDKNSSVVCPLSEANRHMVDAYKLKFHKEAKRLILMDHESIIKLYDVFEENATVYYVMDYIEGGSLESKVMLGGPLSEELAVHYILQVSEALKYMHDKHYLHLDVKPSNIMLSGDKAILVDFGASKHYDDDGGQTSDGPIGVSRGYAPTEQYSNNVDIFSPATDIYALGATLYRILVGQTPPDSATLLTQPEALTFPDFISESLVKVIRKAMAPIPSDRYPAVEAFIQEVDIFKTEIDSAGLEPNATLDQNSNMGSKKGRLKKCILWFILLLILAAAGFMIVRPHDNGNAVTSGQQSNLKDTIQTDSVTSVTHAEPKPKDPPATPPKSGTVSTQVGSTPPVYGTVSTQVGSTPPVYGTDSTQVGPTPPVYGTDSTSVGQTSSATAKLQEEDGKTWVYVALTAHEDDAIQLPSLKIESIIKNGIAADDIVFTDSNVKAEIFVEVSATVKRVIKGDYYAVWIDYDCSIKNGDGELWAASYVDCQGASILNMDEAVLESGKAMLRDVINKFVDIN